MLYATVRQRKIYVKNPVTVIQNGRNVDELTLNMDDEWAKMDSIVCVFTLKYKVAVEEEVEQEDGTTQTVTQYEDKEVAKQVLHSFGEPVQVPWECLVETGLLSVSCTGYVGGEKVMTTMMPDSFWTVVQNGPVEGEETIEATQTLYEQIMAAAGRAVTAAEEAEDARAQLLKDKESGAFDGVSPTVEVGSVATGAAGTAAQVENAGTPQAVKLNFTIPRGAPGTAGRGISALSYDNGVWSVTYTDGVRQVLNGPSGMSYPIVREVVILDGKLVVSSASSDVGTHVEAFDLPAGSGSVPTKLSELQQDESHRTVTDEQIEEWNSKSEFSGSWYALEDKPVLPYQLTANGLDGALLIRNTNETIQQVQLLPEVSAANAGAFLRLDSDGYLAWQILTDVSKEGA